MTYVLGVEEVTTASVTGQQPATATTSYYPLPGGVTASRDASGLTYQGTDLLGTPIAALNPASGVVGEQLRAPYGQARFSAAASTGGGMHTTFGFTGQREDTQAAGSSGLDYFNARYFDPVVGQFTSADPTRPDLGSPFGTNAYGYVGGQVETATDPSGLEICIQDCAGAGGIAEAPPEIPRAGSKVNTGRGGMDGAPWTEQDDIIAAGVPSTGPGADYDTYYAKLSSAIQQGEIGAQLSQAFRTSTLTRGFARALAAEQDMLPQDLLPAVNGQQLHRQPDRTPNPHPTRPKPTEPKPGPGGSGQPPSSGRPPSSPGGGVQQWRRYDG